jgi:menaquinone-dependent protoporphyrinogen oxidase
MNSIKSGKILITYATRTGSSKGVSEAIGKTLSELGENVEVISMNDVKDITSYKAIIAGSAIQAGKWLPEAMDFVQTHKTILNKKPFAIFLVCMTLAMPKGESFRSMISEWLNPVRNLATPVSEGIFAGTLDIKKIPSFSDRLKFKISVLLGVWKAGDHRDWEAIDTWARNLKTILDTKLGVSYN